MELYSMINMIRYGFRRVTRHWPIMIPWTGATTVLHSPIRTQSAILKCRMPANKACSLWLREGKFFYSTGRNWKWPVSTNWSLSPTIFPISFSSIFCWIKMASFGWHLQAAEYTSLISPRSNSNCWQKFLHLRWCPRDRLLGIREYVLSSRRKMGIFG